MNICLDIHEVFMDNTYMIYLYIRIIIRMGLHYKSRPGPFKMSGPALYMSDFYM